MNRSPSWSLDSNEADPNEDSQAGPVLNGTWEVGRIWFLLSWRSIWEYQKDKGWRGRCKNICLMTFSPSPSATFKVGPGQAETPQLRRLGQLQDEAWPYKILCFKVNQAFQELVVPQVSPKAVAGCTNFGACWASTTKPEAWCRQLSQLGESIFFAWPAEQSGQWSFTIFCPISCFQVLVSVSSTKLGLCLWGCWTPVIALGRSMGWSTLWSVNL